MSRIAQDMLLEHGITLVINVKPVSFFCVCVIAGQNTLSVVFQIFLFLNLASVGQSELCDPRRPCYVHGPATHQTSSGYLPQVLHAALHFDQ